MKSMLLAVFGHYDSRGGTMAIPIEANTPEAIDKAKAIYDKDVFGYEPETNIAENAGVGRQVDKLVDQLMRGDQTPAEADYMYVAELHYPDDLDPEGELQTWHFGEGNGGLDVLIELSDDYRTGPANFDSLKERVVQLELVQIPDGFFKDIDELETLDEAQTQKEMDKVNPPRDGTGPGDWGVRNLVNGFSSNDPDQVKWIRADYKSRGDKREGMKTERLKQLTKVLKQPTQTRWDDDAYGFVVVR